jgi:hypothetical protein
MEGLERYQFAGQPERCKSWSLAPKKKVFVQFTSSERLTAQLREGFAIRGFEVVPTAKEAEVSI